MANILETIAVHARVRVEADKKTLPPEDLMRIVGRIHGTEPRFGAALAGDGLRFICEIKKASPSKGVISEDFPYRDIARAYDRAGADAVSCLTEPKWFLGSDDIFEEVRALTDRPMIRKDFVVDEYQIWQARLMGADAVLLICALLDAETLERYLELCAALGLDALVEAHDEAEIDMAATAGAKIIGVNNRNLKDFSVDLGNACRLRARIPDGTLFVAESGVSGPEDAARLAAAGADAVLVGEYLMRAADPVAALAALREAAR